MVRILQNSRKSWTGLTLDCQRNTKYIAAPVQCLIRHYTSPVQPDLTSVRYPHVKRGKYSELTSQDVEFFQKLLTGDGRVLTEPDDVAAYNTDWLRTVKGWYY